MRRLALWMLLVSLVAAGCGETEPEDPDLAEGRSVYTKCAACHGREGKGGVGPALSGVTATFPDCDTHVQWITFGSQMWKDNVGDTYGSSGKPIEGAMPAFDALSERERRLVAFYERVEFGGGNIDAERAACGLSIWDD